MSRPVAGESWTGLILSMKALRAHWPQRGWSWDSRLSCVSSSFTVELADDVKAIALRLLPKEWEPSTIATASPATRKIVERSGGLRPGQLLLTGEPAGRLFAFGLWWPWGDGITTTLRIGLSDSYVSEEALAGLRGAFGVSL